MRAMTLTQPWAGLVASGIKLVENRPRPMIRRENFGEPFALHASREADDDVYERIAEIAPELITIAQNVGGGRDRFYVDTNGWFRLSQITSAVIAVATVDSVIDPLACGIDPDSDDARAALPPDQRRWFFGPIGYVLRDVVALPTPVPCRGWQGFWTLRPELEAQVRAQPEPIGSLIARSSIGAGLANIRENGIEAELADLDEERRR